MHRLVNTTRWKGKHQIAISFFDKQVPTGPAEKPATGGQAAEVEAKLLALFEERPMWTRMAITNSLDEDSAKIVTK